MNYHYIFLEFHDGFIALYSSRSPKDIWVELYANYEGYSMLYFTYKIF
jgi:hypothetical protein